MTDFLVSALLLIANLLSLLFKHAAKTVHATMPAVPAMTLASSALGFLAMRIDKAQVGEDNYTLNMTISSATSTLYLGVKIRYHP
jgi:translation initiation factor 2B subunit (eIF-2B alpha/beta/delta family)